MHYRTNALSHFFTFLLALAPLISSALTEDDYTYTVTDGQATITDFNSDYSGALAITNTLGGYPVTTIGDSAFDSCTSLTSVTIPDSVTSIGSSAFSECYSLTSVTIGNSVTTIGERAFDFCNGLTSVTIPDSVTTIGAGAFFMCEGLTNLVIGSGVTSIGDGAFCDCSGLTSVTIPNSVTTIGHYAFGNCSLTSVTIPDSVTTIGYSAFCCRFAMTNITVDAANATYSSTDGVLFNKSFTTLIEYPSAKAGSYTIPDSVTAIGYEAFALCTGLTSITLPASVTSVGDWAFQGCINLTAVFFKGNQPTSIGSDSFYYVSPMLYYLPVYVSNWPATLAGLPTLCWNPTVQRDAAFGFASGRFGFNIAGTPNIPVKIETTTSLVAGIWAPVTNATINAAGSLYISDPSSSNQPSRFYRIVWP